MSNPSTYKVKSTGLYSYNPFGTQGQKATKAIFSKIGDAIEIEFIGRQQDIPRQWHFE